MSESFPVKLRVYDISRGMAKNMSMALIQRQIDGIWHTGIDVYGLEYFFGGGGVIMMPAEVVEREYNMSPVEIIDLGSTELTRDIFEDYVKELAQSKFNGSNYDLINNNCNNFSDECASFLLGSGIPSHIVDLPKTVMETPLGRMLLPLLSSNIANGQQIPGMANSNQGFRVEAPVPTPASRPQTQAQPATANGEVGSLEQACTRIRENKEVSTELKIVCFQTLIKLASNLIANPSNPKMTNISLDVPAISTRIGSIPGGTDALHYLGFTRQADGTSFQCDISAIGIDALIRGKNVIESHLKVAEGKVTEVPTVAPSVPAAASAHPAQGLLQGLMNSHPAAAGLMQNPQLMQHAMSMLQSNPRLANIAQGMMSSGQFNPQSLTGLLSDGSGSQRAPPPPAPSRPTQGRFVSEIAAIKAMGFTDETKIAAALDASGGDMADAVSYLTR